MSKRKGLSFDEKKATMLSAMHADGMFYTLKELEALGKAKGVIPQAVKEVVEALCADGEVQNDKVGTQQLFWALASAKAASLRTKRQKLDQEAEGLAKEHDQLKAQLAALKAEGSVPSPRELAELRARAAAERQRRDALRKQIEAFERLGPGKLGEIRTQTAVAKEAANRWADNICAVRSMFLRERRGEVSSHQFNTMFNLPDDFDYLE